MLNKNVSQTYMCDFQMPQVQVRRRNVDLVWNRSANSIWLHVCARQLWKCLRRPSNTCQRNDDGHDTLGGKNLMFHSRIVHLGTLARQRPKWYLAQNKDRMQHCWHQHVHFRRCASTAFTTAVLYWPSRGSMFNIMVCSGVLEEGFFFLAWLPAAASSPYLSTVDLCGVGDAVRCFPTCGAAGSPSTARGLSDLRAEGLAAGESILSDRVASRSLLRLPRLSLADFLILLLPSSRFVSFLPRPIPITP